MTGFVKPDDSYAVYEKTGRFYIEEEGFFSCIVSVVFITILEEEILSLAEKFQSESERSRSNKSLRVFQF